MGQDELTDFVDRVILVTGATRGIGAAIAEEFWSRGANVIITGTRQDQIDRLNQFKPERKSHIRAEFSDHSSMTALEEYINSLERLDVCVNNAGINIIKHVDHVSSEDFARITSVNFRAPYFIAQWAARVMRRRRRGWIVNIGSIWSVITKRGRSQYTATKSALAGMTRALATEFAVDGILVNCVSPGFVMTDLTRQSLSPEEIKVLAEQVPLGRFAEPNEIARLVVFLGSSENTYITGQNIIADGGFTNV